MANIKVYEAPVVGLDISDRGVEGFSQASVRARQMGVQSKHSLDEAGKEIGGGLEAVGGELRREARLKDDDKVSAQALLSQNTASNDAARQLEIDANESYKDFLKGQLTGDKYDPDGYKTWLQDKLQPMIEKYRGTAQSTKNGTHIESHVEHIADTYLKRSINDDSHVQGYRAQRAYETRVATNMSRIDESDGDPNTLKEVQKSLDIDVQGMSGALANLSAEEAVQFEKHKAAVQRGFTERSAEKYVMAAKTPDDIAKRIAEVKDPKGPWGSNEYPLGQKDFEKVDTWGKHAQTNFEHKNIQLRQGAERDFNKVAGDMIDELHTKGPTPNVFEKIKEWRNDPNHPERVEQISEARLNSFYESYRKEAGNRDDVTKLPDQETLQGFRKRLGDGEIVSVDELYKAKSEGKISKDQYDEFHARSKELSTADGKDLNAVRKEFVDGQKLIIDPEYGQRKYPQGTPLGTVNRQKMEMDLRKAEEALKADNKNPKSLYDPASPNYFGKPENMQRYVADKAGNDVYEKQLANQAKQNNGVTDQLFDHIRSVEGWTPVSKWDNKQHSWGYGTKAPGAGLTIDRKQAEEELKAEVGKAARLVDGYTPSAPPGVRDALISLTYNAGTDWQGAGLGAAIKAGDWITAKERFLQYTKSNNPNDKPGLEARRAKEAVWFDKAIAGQQAALPYAKTPAEAMEKYSPGTMIRTDYGVYRVPRKKQ